VQGASHRRRKLPNQDAVCWRSGAEGRVAVSVADGHGSPACFRSGDGARLAVETATELLMEMTEEVPAGGATWMAKELVRRWRAAVERDAAANPLPSPAAKPRAVWQIYGCTLLAVSARRDASGTDRIRMIQIGDGDLLLISGDGSVRRPWPRDPNLLGDQTTSMSGQNAWRDIRIAFLETDDPPELILLATDGYSNSYSRDEGFLRVGTDLMQSIRAEGLPSVEAHLEEWLDETSRLGSGDDITVGLAARKGELRAG